MNQDALHDVLTARAVLRAGKPMVALRYVGAKPSKVDTLAGSRVTWRGPGDVREVPLDAAKRLLRHPDVWALPDAPWEPPAPPPLDMEAKQQLSDLVLAGAWRTIERQWPAAFNLALLWFEERLTGPDAEPLDLALQDADDAAWVKTVIGCNRMRIEELLNASSERLMENPDLYDALIQAERRDKVRMTVIELIMRYRAKAQAARELLEAPDVSEATPESSHADAA